MARISTALALAGSTGRASVRGALGGGLLGRDGLPPQAVSSTLTIAMTSADDGEGRPLHR